MDRYQPAEAQIDGYRLETILFKSDQILTNLLFSNQSLFFIIF